MIGLSTHRLSPVAPLLRRSAAGVTAVPLRPFSATTGSLKTYSPNDYYGNSVIPTFAFQKSLPRLPVPKLDDTLNKYVGYVEPLVDAETLEATKVAVEEFRSGVGPKAQEGLERRDKAHPETSYISEIWYDMYLSNRDSFPLNLTPQLIWKDDVNPAKMDQAARAADLTAAAVRFQRSVEAKVLEPDAFRMSGREPDWVAWAVGNLVPERLAYYPMYYYGVYALDMYQYKNLFYSTRIPHRGKDELRVAKKCRHVAVQRGSRIYTIDVFDAELAPLSPSAIEAQLRAILAADDAATAASGPAIGSLTTLDRDTWADTRAHMETSRVNKASLEAVDSALFVLTLEDDAPASEADTSRCMLHGQGRNRWFDKNFNIVVCGNGKAGIAWEHAWGDGVAVLNFFNTVYDEISTSEARSPATESLGGVNLLPWHVDNKVQSAISQAESTLSQQIAECDLKIYKTDALTKSDIKASKLSPDGVMQMALQLAHWRTHGYTASTYESASTAAFKHGRTETIRSATVESAAFCSIMDNKTASLEEKHALLKAATERHADTTKDCVMGKGVDRHLFALEDQTKRMGLPTPDIFSDAGMQVMRDIRLSTSTLASPALAGGGFGPVSRTSYGVGYGVAEEGCAFHIMAYGLDTDGMCENADRALREMQEVMAYQPAAADEKK